MAPQLPDRIAAFRQALIDDLGTDTIHVLENGAAIGAAIGLYLTFPPAAVILVVGLGASPKRASLVAIVSELLGMLASKEARRQESYFAGGILGGSVAGVVAGSVLKMASIWGGVDVPTVGEVLAALA